jgi:hypothetical protein
MKRENAKARIATLLSNLNEDEKSYVKTWVISAIDELKSKEEKKPKN